MRSAWQDSPSRTAPNTTTTTPPPPIVLSTPAQGTLFSGLQGEEKHYRAHIQFPWQPDLGFVLKGNPYPKKKN